MHRVPKDSGLCPQQASQPLGTALERRSPNISSFENKRSLNPGNPNGCRKLRPHSYWACTQSFTPVPSTKQLAEKCLNGGKVDSLANLQTSASGSGVCGSPLGSGAGSCHLSPSLSFVNTGPCGHRFCPFAVACWQCLSYPCTPLGPQLSKPAGGLFQPSAPLRPCLLSLAMGLQWPRLCHQLPRLADELSLTRCCLVAPSKLAGACSSHRGCLLNTWI